MPEMTRLQEPNSIWTWKSNARNAKASLWLPYFQSVQKIKGMTYELTYNNDTIRCDLKKIDFIMLYGASGSLPVEFLDDLNKNRIPLFVHRRNMDRPYIFFSSQGNDDKDILTSQLLFRRNRIKATYISRVLIRERLRKMSRFISTPQIMQRKLSRCRSVEQVRGLEAEFSRQYWERYFRLVAPEQTLHRRTANSVSQALNACSLFLSGVLLRWVLFHKLSPSHGYLHVRTGYQSLVYDLMEPYRYIIENAVLEAASKTGIQDNTKLIASALNVIKRVMDEPVYVPMTRQTVRRKNLLHGVVLALRAYLAGDMKRLIVPAEGDKMGGRPPSVSYKMPGGQ